MDARFARLRNLAATVARWIGFALACLIGTPALIMIFCALTYVFLKVANVCMNLVDSDYLEFIGWSILFHGWSAIIVAKASQVSRQALRSEPTLIRYHSAVIWLFLFPVITATISFLLAAALLELEPRLGATSLRWAIVGIALIGYVRPDFRNRLIVKAREFIAILYKDLGLGQFIFAIVYWGMLPFLVLRFWFTILNAMLPLVWLLLVAWSAAIIVLLILREIWREYRLWQISADDTDTGSEVVVSWRRRFLILVDESGPRVSGILRPCIGLPSDVFDQWTRLKEDRIGDPTERAATRTRLKLILAHELDHVRRRDYLKGAVADLLRPALLYHQAAGPIVEWFRIEQECLCDERAIRSRIGRNFAIYLDMLLEFASKRPALLASWFSQGELAYRAVSLREFADRQASPRTRTGARGSGRLGTVLIPLGLAAFLALALCLTPHGSPHRDRPSRRERAAQLLDSFYCDTAVTLRRAADSGSVAARREIGIWPLLHNVYHHATDRKCRYQ